MLTLQNPLPTDIQSLRQIYIECCEDSQGNSSDPTKGAARVKLLYPTLIAAMNSASDASRQVVENDDKAQRAAIPQVLQDTAELYKNASVEDLSAIWRLGQNSFDPQYASKAFDFLVTSFAKNKRLSYPESETKVRTQFTSLSALSDSQKCAAKLGVELPPTSTPGNPAWSPKTGLNTPSTTPAKVKSGGLNAGRTGLGAFSVGNDDGEQGVAPGWDRTFPDPLNDRDRRVAKYIVGLLARLDTMAGTLDAQSLAVLQAKLDGTTVKQDAAAPAVENSRLVALGNSKEELHMVSNSVGWRFAN